MAGLTAAGFAAMAQTKETSLSLDSPGDRKDILERTLKSELQQIQHRQGIRLMVLASIGSTAPSSACSAPCGDHARAEGHQPVHSASLDIVAGPVGEALTATAFGIATAIPAVLATTMACAGCAPRCQPRPVRHRLPQPGDQDALPRRGQAAEGKK